MALEYGLAEGETHEQFDTAAEKMETWGKFMALMAPLTQTDPKLFGAGTSIALKKNKKGEENA